MSDLFPTLILSLKIALASTALVALIGIPLAYLMARRAFRGRSLVEALLVLPLVLPPTVVGYFILVTLGARSPIGRVLEESFGYSFLFNWHGAVVASTAVALPLLYLPARASFAGVEPDLEDVARLMGAGPLRVFWHVSLPMARRGIGSGLLLAFARALGEFGATVMVMGDLPRRQTLPISIYNNSIGGNLTAVVPAVAALTLVSFVVIVFYNRSTLGRRD
jgi:molybdate transport system permease protein